MLARNTGYRELEEIVRTSEILAVARALHVGERVHVGQEIDYFIDPDARNLAKAIGRSVQRGLPYRTRVEAWHLEEARRVVERWRK